MFSTAKGNLGNPAPLAPDAVVYAAKWKKDGRLVTQRETAFGAELTETYQLAAGGEQLRVTVEVGGSGRRPKIKLLRIYDRQSEDAPEPEANTHTNFDQAS